MLDAEGLKAAVIEEEFDIFEAIVDEVAWYVDAGPVFAQEEELPAGGIGHLDDEATVGVKEFAGGFEIGGGIVEVLKDVKEGDGGAAFLGKRRLGEGSTNDGDAVVVPGRGGGTEREVEANAGPAALGEHAEKQAATAADIEQGTVRRATGEGAFDKADVIAEDEAAIQFLELGDGVGFGDIPVGVGVILAEFGRGGPGMEAEEPAGATFDDAEGFGGGAVETVGGFKEDADGATVAGGAGIAFFDAVGMGNGFSGGDVRDGLEGQIACSFSSRRGIWWRLRRAMI